MDKHSSIFFEEAVDLLTQLEGLLIDLEENHNDIEQINLLLRILHTLKGSGSMFGYNDLAAFVHIIESVYEKIRNGEFEITPSLINKTLHSRDLMMALISPEESKSKENLEIVADLSGFFLNFGQRSALDSFAEGIGKQTKKSGSKKSDSFGLNELDSSDQVIETTEEKEESTQETSDEKTPIAQPTQTWKIVFEPFSSYFGYGNNPLSILQELSDLGETVVKVDDSNVPDSSEINPELCYLKWEITLTTSFDENAIRDVFIFVEDLCNFSLELISGDLPAPLSITNSEKTQHQQTDNEIGKETEAPMVKTSTSESEKQESEPKKNAENTQDSANNLPIAKTVENKKANINEELESNDNNSVLKYDENKESRSEYQKIDHLINLLGELVTIQARLSQNASSKGDSELISLAQELEILTGDLRDSALKMSMLPIGSLYPKLIKVAESAALKGGKQIDVKINGSETELDKEVLDRLFIPLKNLIENSIEHGFESAELREISEKPIKGVLSINAWQANGNIFIEVSDDGQGIDPEELKNVIASRNPNQTFDDRETDLFKLICLATNQNKKLNKNHGEKALGLASVKQAINGMRGSLELKSFPGKGTSFTIKLPLNLGIVEGLMVRLEESLFLIPLSSVEECIELTKEDQKRNFEKNVIMVRGQLVPYIQLRETFEISGEAPDIQQIVITFVDKQRIGFVVDQVIGEYQTVIKSWGKFCNDIPGISGATILGDGTVALIADPGILIRGQNSQAKAEQEGEDYGF